MHLKAHVCKYMLLNAYLIAMAQITNPICVFIQLTAKPVGRELVNENCCVWWLFSYQHINLYFHIKKKRYINEHTSVAKWRSHKEIKQKILKEKWIRKILISYWNAKSCTEQFVSVVMCATKATHLYCMLWCSQTWY